MHSSSARRSPRDQQPLTGTLDAIRRIIRVLRLSSRRSERELKIGSAQLFVLQQLAAGPVRSVNELAERTYTHQSSVSVVVRRLVAQGLVARRPAAEDRRRRELRLTKAGERLLARAPVPAQVRLINGLRTLPAAKLRTLSRLLGQVVIAMGASAERPGMFFTEAPHRPPRSERYGAPRPVVADPPRFGHFVVTLFRDPGPSGNCGRRLRGAAETLALPAPAAAGCRRTGRPLLPRRRFPGAPVGWPRM